MTRRLLTCHLLGRCLGALLISTSLIPTALSQTYPTKPIRVLIGQAGGGAVDSVARVLAEAMSTSLGQPVVVESRPGAAGMIAADAVARAGADGYTLGLLDVGALAVNPSLQKSISYEVPRDFAFVGAVAKIPLVLVAHPSAPVSTLADLTAYAKQFPDRLSYASSGVGSPLHLAFEAYKQRTGAAILHIPYKGGAPALADVAAGHVPLAFIDTNLGAQYTLAKRVKPIAIGTLERSPQLPDVPTFDEAGLKGFESVPWVGLIAPRALPAAAAALLSEALASAMRDERLLAKLREFGFQPFSLAGERFAAFVQTEADGYRDLIRSRDIRLAE